jgi:GAF domain-containing protein
VDVFEEAMEKNALLKVQALEAILQLPARNLGFREFVRELLLVLIKAVRSEAGSILELDHASQSLFFRAAVGTNADRVNSFTVPMGQGVVGHVAESLKPLVVNDLEKDRVHLKVIQEAVGFPMRNLIAAPILVRGKLFGVLELLNRVGEPGYSSEDVELIEYLCTQAARALELRLMLSWSARKAA